jgi:hypothetical protein
VNDDGSPMGIVFAARAIDQTGLRKYKSFMTALSQASEVAAAFSARNSSIARRTDAPIDPTIRIYHLH